MWAPDHGGSYAAAIVMPLIASIFFGLRIWAKKIKDTKLTVDDCVLFMALISVWLLAVAVIIGVAVGSIGVHTYVDPITGIDDKPPAGHFLEKIEFSFILIERVAFGLTKLAVLLWYRQIFIGRAFNIASWFMIGFVIVWSLTFLFLTAFICGTDIRRYWGDLETSLEYCLSPGTVQVAYGTLDVASDLVILALPIPNIWILQATTIKRVGICVLFSLGIISTLFGAVRLGMWIYVEFYSVPGYRDFQGLLTNCLVWSLVSAAVAIVGVSLPLMRPIFSSRGAESLVHAARQISLSSFRSGKSGKRANKDAEEAEQGDDNQEPEDERDHVLSEGTVGTLASREI